MLIYTHLAGSLPCSTYFVLIITLSEEYTISKITFPIEVLSTWCIGVLRVLRAFHIETIHFGEINTLRYIPVGTGIFKQCLFYIGCQHCINLII